MESMRRLTTIFALAASMVLLAGVPANAATTRFEGEVTTSPGTEISFSVVEKRGKRPEIRRMRVSTLTAFCDDGEQTVPVIIGGDGERFARLNRRGRFSKTQSSDRFDLQVVSVVNGRVERRKGRGLMSVSLRTEGLDCSTGVDRWEVDRVG
ncbi:hypothetical protein HJD18_08095 [Thermoleophilia bacterium SCSIO 60948]|nr:hypothetical protein HJD18_08095 [Thermoleophilia bacterium SCSIO 60948]